MPNRRRFLALATLASSAGLPFLSACTSGTKQTDVVIIGAGHSGLAAAVSAAQQGAKVTVIEKRPFVGLNTHSDRGFFASSLSPKGLPSYGDSPENHFQQSYSAGSSLADVELLRTYARKAPETLAWLDSLGMRFAENPINSNSLWRRCYQPLHSGYTETLYREALIRGVEFVFGHPVESLAIRNDKTCSVSAKNVKGESETWEARKAVILCSGGFGANKELIAQYAPRYKDLNSDNELGSTGEVLLLAQKIGAGLTGMDRISCLPRPPGTYILKAICTWTSLVFFTSTATGNGLSRRMRSGRKLLKPSLNKAIGIFLKSQMTQPSTVTKWISSAIYGAAASKTEPSFVEKRWKI